MNDLLEYISACDVIINNLKAKVSDYKEKASSTSVDQYIKNHMNNIQTAKAEIEKFELLKSRAIAHLINDPKFIEITNMLSNDNQKNIDVGKNR